MCTIGNIFPAAAARRLKRKRRPKPPFRKNVV
jgi:hypothetical protein